MLLRSQQTQKRSTIHILRLFWPITLIFGFIFLSGIGLLRLYPIDEDPIQADAILVLGCAANQDGSPSPLLRSRVEKGVELWHRGYANRLIFTGAAVANSSVEAEVMANLALSLGVPNDKIVKDTKARSTVENALQTAEILTALNFKKALVVTSPFHTRRARYLFSKQSYHYTYVAAPYPDETDLRTKLFLSVKDCLKLIYQSVYQTNN